MKKILNILLSVVLLGSILAIPVSAAEKILITGTETTGWLLQNGNTALGLATFRQLHLNQIQIF